MSRARIPPAQALAAELAEHFGRYRNVRAVALAGSSTTSSSDALSDIDLYVYCDGEVPLGDRTELARSRSVRFEVGNTAFEAGDEWQDERTGVGVDIIYRDPRWIEGVLTDVLESHRASIGYSTCFWHNVLTSRPLFDRDGWFAALQEWARQTYPDALADAIIDTNLPLLCERISSFGNQIRKTAARGDRVAVNHRIAAFLASYFDVLFAFNRAPHPGEKRLREHADRLPALPKDWSRDVERLLDLAPHGGASDLHAAAEALEAGLRDLIQAGRQASRQA